MITRIQLDKDPEEAEIELAETLFGFIRLSHISNEFEKPYYKRMVKSFFNTAIKEGLDKDVKKLIEQKCSDLEDPDSEVIGLINEMLSFIPMRDFLDTLDLLPSREIH